METILDKPEFDLLCLLVDYYGQQTRLQPVARRLQKKLKELYADDQYALYQVTRIHPPRNGNDQAGVVSTGGGEGIPQDGDF